MNNSSIKPPFSKITYIYKINEGLTMEINIDKINRLRSLLMTIYCEKEGIRRCGNLMKSSSMKVLTFKYGKENAIIRYNELREKDKIKNTLIGFINRYGEEEGTNKYYEKNKKLSVSVESLRRSGFSDAEIINIRDKHKTNSKTDLKTMISKYGEKEGLVRHTKKMENHYNPWDYKRIMSYSGVTENEAKKIIGIKQTRDKEYYANKYGYEIGIEKYDNANKKRAYANTKQYYVEKYGEELGLIKYNELCVNRGRHSKLEFFVDKFGEEEGKKKYNELIKLKVNYFPNFSSNVELEFNQSIFNLLSDSIKKHFYGSPITKPYYLNVDKNIYGLTCIVPDIKIKNIIIEFDGDYWHSLPNVIQRDELKNKIYNDHSFYLIRIKESNYLINKEKEVNKIITLIKKNIIL